MQKYFLIPNSSNQKQSSRIESFGTNSSHILMQKSISLTRKIENEIPRSRSQVHPQSQEDAVRPSSVTHNKWTSRQWCQRKVERTQVKPTGSQQPHPNPLPKENTQTPQHGVQGPQWSPSAFLLCHTSLSSSFHQHTLCSRRTAHSFS